MQSVDDQQVMSRFHYKQELQRTIRLFGSFAIAFSFISITTGIFANYSLVLKRSGPAGFWTWPLVTVGQLFVALVFAELSAKMPLTGYSYQWVSRLAGPGWGWFTGWIAICFLIIVVPSVDHGIASVLGYIFGIEDQSALLKVIVCGTMAVQGCIHIFGVRWANRINSAAVFTEVIGMVGLVAVFGFLALKNHVSLGILFDRGPVLATGQSYLPSFIMACLMGAYTLVGFESASNLSEETVNASATVPKAVIWSVIVSGAIGTLFLLLTALGIRDRDGILNSDYPLPTIIESNLGTPFAYAFFGLVVISIFACGLVIMASGSRLIYALARDDVFMVNQLFRRISPHSSVPVPAILLMMALGIVAEIFSESLQQLLTAAAVLPALIYLLTVVAYAARRRSLPTPAGTFTLGRWGGLVAGLATAWLVLILTILTVPKEFKSATWISALLCLVGWILYVGWIRSKIARGVAGIRRDTLKGSPEVGR